MLSKNNIFLLFLLLICLKVVAGDEVRIKNVDDFKNFMNDVNSGTSDFEGITVLLDTDLSLSDKTLEPIGNTYTNYFLGTFDGQGHIISDLKMNSSSSYYTGLFGYSEGLTIRNVVLDSSCSITNSRSGSGYVRIGGVIGYCQSNSGKCNVENSVNMASIYFGGSSTSSYLVIGGIVGELYSSSSYPIFVKNCANYGSITHSGTSSSSRIGGIAGWLDGLSSSNYKYIYNCLNYGTITHSSTTSYLYLGGIIGYSQFAYIENCVSAGKISSTKTSYIGSIVGYVESNTYINYCYYTSDLSEYDLYGYGTPASSSYTLSYDNITFKLRDGVSVGSYTGTSLVDALNAAADYYFLRDYSKWLLNKEEKSVTFTINSRTSPITTNYQVILFPSPPSRGSLMFRWYNDAECSYPLESFEVTEDATLYGRLEENTNKYTITFDTRKEYTYFAPITAQFGTTVPLPSKFVEGQCGVAFWETEYGDDLGLDLTMPAHNFTLYAVWKCTHLVTLDDFIEFADKVNSGKDDFNGITVLLDSDLSLSGKTLEPIGKYDYNYFRGAFDGQGHVISDLKIKTSYYFTGLFGYSRGLTIRNVVLDSSCSIISSDDAGGIIGWCIPSEKGCIIENSVNMADITGTGSVSLGGIVGKLYSSKYPAYVKNCANYGSITHSGTSSSYIGGIAGEIYDLNIYNCLNYGTITHSGTTSSELHIGGIVGYSDYYAYIENCVSAGEISTQNTPSSSYIGSFVGYVDSDSKTYIKNSFWTSGVGEYPINGSGSPTIDDETSQAEVNMALVNKLNSYASMNSTWNKWLLNTNNASITFKVDDNAGFTANSQIILLPDLVDNEERSFIGWYTDATLTSLFTGNEVNAETTLYGVFCGPNYIVTFGANGGNDLNEGEDKMVIECSRTYGAFPVPTRKGYTFVGWFTERERGKKIEQGNKTTILNNHTLYAHWKINNYTVTFDANGGNALPVPTTTVTFNNIYGTLPEAEKPGYMFMGWFTEKVNGTKVTSETIVTIPNNHTLYAHWDVPTNQVEVVFSKKDLSKDDVEKIIREYVDGKTEFEIEVINGIDETKVIIKFADAEKAVEFVRNVNELSKDDSNNMIKRVDFVSNNASFSPMLYPVLSFVSLI